MNDIFGIDPASIRNVRDLADITRLIHPSEGRFISQFPPNWAEMVKAGLNGLRDLDQSRFFELWISRARCGLIPSSAKFDCSKKWVSNAERIRLTSRAIIGSSSDFPLVTPIESALVNPMTFPDSRSEYIKRTAEEYARVSKPLFQISKKIVLVDPYFRLAYFDERAGKVRGSLRHLKSLKSLLTECAKERKVEVFCLVVNKEVALRPYLGVDAESHFERDLTHIQAESMAQDFQLEYRYLDRAAYTDQHPRYLLGNYAGLHFDWGFDTGDVEQRNLVSWLSESALAPLLDRFF